MNRDGLPDTSFSQIAGMSGIMSRRVVTIGAIILVLPKIGAASAPVPLPVLGGGVIVMFGMLATVTMNLRRMVIIAVSLAFGLGLNLVPTAVQHLPGVPHTMAVSGLLPTAVIATVLNQVLPEDI